jgi:hypothetical protein
MESEHLSWYSQNPTIEPCLQPVNSSLRNFSMSFLSAFESRKCFLSSTIDFVNILFPPCVVLLLLLVVVGRYWVPRYLLVPGTAATLAYCTNPMIDKDDFWSNLWNENWQGKPKYSEKTYPSATLSTKSHMTDPVSNPGPQRWEASD